MVDEIHRGSIGFFSSGLLEAKAWTETSVRISIASRSVDRAPDRTNPGHNQIIVLKKPATDLLRSPGSGTIGLVGGLMFP
jgi:hypothetical protein